MTIATLPFVEALPPRVRTKVRMEPPPADPCAQPVVGPCWAWTGPLTKKGYVDIRFGAEEGHGRWLLHRWTYTYFIGPIPSGLQIDHLCRRTSCCNPLHLEAVTPKVNQERGIRRQATHCQRGHEFAGHNLIIKKGNGCRECRACKYEAQRRSLAQRRAAGLPDGHRLHGTVTGYMNYRCRCEPCRAAGAEAWRRNPHSAGGRRRRADVEALIENGASA